MLYYLSFCLSKITPLHVISNNLGFIVINNMTDITCTYIEDYVKTDLKKQSSYVVTKVD